MSNIEVGDIVWSNKAIEFGTRKVMRGTRGRVARIEGVLTKKYTIEWYYPRMKMTFKGTKDFNKI